VSIGLLLSGGQDSIALAWWKRPSVAFTIDYGQASAEGEIRASQAVAEVLGIELECIRVDCRQLGSGELAGQPALPIAPMPEWWPYRNQLIVTIASMRALKHGIQRLLLGTVITDAAHRDGTPTFVDNLDALLACQEGALRVEAPAIALSTIELIRRSGVPMEVLGYAHSCHRGSFACGACRGCMKYSAVVQALGNETAAV
jgi:7-cyano-7-deazaguanine synthase